MGYQETWIAAKRAFETATNKKKPDAGFFHFSGVESAAKELDKALEKPDAVGLAKAEAGFHKAQQEYLKATEKAKRSDRKSDEYKTEVDKLIKCLETLSLDFSKAKGAAILAAESAKAKAVFDSCQAVLIEVLGERRSAVASAMESERAVLSASGKDDKGRKAAADKAKAAMKAIEEARKKATSLFTKEEAARTANLAKIDRAAFPAKGNKSELQNIADESLAAIYQMRDVVAGMDALFESARAAEAATKTASNDAALLASAGRFARIAPIACEVIDSALRTLGGLTDLASFEKLNANESDDPVTKERLLRRSRSIVATANALKENVERDLPGYQQSIQAFRDALPAKIRTSPAVKQDMEDLDEALSGFGPNAIELAKCVAKLKTLA